MRSMLEMFDTKLTTAITRLPSWLRPLMSFVTLIGGPVFTVGIGLLLFGFGLAKPDEDILQAGFVIVATIATGALLKLLLRRKRPITYIVRWPFMTFSFPSGHTVGSVVAYGALAYVSLRFGNLWGFVGTAIFSFLAVLVGVTRVYLGAHFPSDVAAGWVVGGAGLLMIILMIQPAI
ncbi:MAG TPA: phosphatase PAP2 family protein [Candidatus Saccharimonadales bacterium]